MRNLVFLMSAVAFFFTACASQTEFESTMNAWIGQSTDSLITSWGEPISIVEIPNGNAVYVYQFGQLGSADSIDPIRGVARSEYICRLGIEIENGLLKSYEYNGGHRTCAGYVPKLRR